MRWKESLNIIIVFDYLEQILLTIKCLAAFYNSIICDRFLIVWQSGQAIYRCHGLSIYKSNQLQFNSSIVYSSNYRLLSTCYNSRIVLLIIPSVYWFMLMLLISLFIYEIYYLIGYFLCHCSLITYHFSFLTSELLFVIGISVSPSEYRV